MEYIVLELGNFLGSQKMYILKTDIHISYRFSRNFIAEVYSINGDIILSLINTRYVRAGRVE